MSTQPPYGQPPQGPYPPQGQYPGPYGPPPRRGLGTGGLVAILVAVALVVAGGVVAAVLLLGGEDDEDDSASEETSSQTSDDSEPSGESVTGNGYSYTLPDGWSDVTEEAVSTLDPDIDTASAPSDSLDRTPANLLVSISSAQGATVAGELRSEWEAGIAEDTGVTPTPIPAPDVGGLETAAIQTEQVNSSGTPVIQVGYLTISGGQAYAIFFTTTERTQAENQAAFDELIGTWQWE
jgi:hypothetical protein